MADLQEPNNQQQDADRRQNMRDALAMAAWNARGINPHLTFAMDSGMQGMQNHSNAANAINSAISDEMDSRVAQQREMRRMAHEKELARMRLEAEANRTEEMIRRMEMMQRDNLPPGVISRIRVDGKGRVTHG